MICAKCGILGGRKAERVERVGKFRDFKGERITAWKFILKGLERKKFGRKCRFDVWGGDIVEHGGFFSGATRFFLSALCWY